MSQVYKFKNEIRDIEFLLCQKIISEKKTLCQSLFSKKAAGLVTFLYPLKTSENQRLGFGFAYVLEYW